MIVSDIFYNFIANKPHSQRDAFGHYSLLYMYIASFPDSTFYHTVYGVESGNEAIANYNAQMHLPCPIHKINSWTRDLSVSVMYCLSGE